MFRSAITAATLLAFPSGLLVAQQNPSGTATAAVERVTSARAVRAERAPLIDGRDADEVWQEAPRYSQFRQFQPKVDIDPRFRTEFRAAYDEHNLYVFVRMFDPHPDSIMHALSRRDVRGPSDQIKLLIDSYYDRRSGYELAVNPDGVKRDYAMSNDGQEDDSWNGIWDVATTVDSLGWTAEFRVPLSQLRYNKGTSNTFGFGIWRDLERFAERDSWPLYSPERNGIVSQLGTLDGLAGLSTERRVEVTPYAVTKNVQRQLPTAGYERSQQITGGGDLKLGITPNVTLDATINPDFGQVEADPSVVNLTAFETFFQERRPFFVEGTGLYQFQLNCYIVVDCSTNEGLFYSRRIGRSPGLRDLYGNQDTPKFTTIAGAAKLTGRTSNGFSFGVLDAVTPEVTGVQSRTVEPLANYGVVRAQQDLNDGDVGLSAIATAVDRSVDSWTDPYMHKSAYTGGATFRNRFSNKRYEFAAQVSGSRVEGTPDALLLTQTNGVHFYQQPNDKLVLDPTRTSLSGYEGQLKFGKYGGGITRFETSVVRISPGFEVNDLGYLRRADLMDWSTWAALSFRNAKGIYNWAQVNGNHWETWNTSGTRLENALNFNGHMGLRNNWDVHLGGTYSGLTPRYCDRCTRGGPLVRSSSGFYPWGGVNTDQRKPIYGGAFVNLNFGDEGKTHGAWLSPYVDFRLSSQFLAEVSTGIGRGIDNTQWFGNFDENGVTHYAFARLDQKTTQMSLRMNYTMTPNLTLELYGQPFTSRGTYTDIRELSATPEADSYAARYQPYTPPGTIDPRYKVSELITNSVVRWEYRPGSTLFVVWQHGREGPNPNMPFDQAWTRDYRDLFALHPDNTFLIKVAYWLNR
ncbi:MAG TPA: DUF5916 domain-containing protein [Gemmatimonadaceae bacterium]|nr:DUF5916 domain-containing protein [Gemmatimonadaceae bacterium]